VTYSPQPLLDLRGYLQPITGLDPVSLGIQHFTPQGGGYHEGWDLLAAGYGRDDYSVSESPRDAHPSNAASAIDIGDFGRLRVMSLWLVAQCEAGAPDTADIREIIYTPDGRNVARWDRLSVRDSGDDSHLSHTHISYFRDSEGRDKTALFRRYFEGDDMPWTPDEAKQIQRIDERLGTIIGDLDRAPSLGDVNYVKKRLVDLAAAKPTVAMTDADRQAVASQAAAIVGAQIAALDNKLDEVIRRLTAEGHALDNT
jgi:hypothetical protein